MNHKIVNVYIIFLPDFIFQVCCVLPDQISSFHRQQRLLEYSGFNNFAKSEGKDRIKSGQCGVPMTAAKRVVRYVRN